MEFVKVTFPTNRFVYIDSDQGGTTNEVLRIEAGTHEFDLGNLKNYEPESQEVDVEETTVLLPVVVAKCFAVHKKTTAGATYVHLGPPREQSVRKSTRCKP